MIRINRVGSPLAFARETVTVACHLRMGEAPCSETGPNVKAFSMHKAKAMSLGMVSFPTFVIRTNRQRSSYGKPGEDGELVHAGR